MAEAIKINLFQIKNLLGSLKKTKRCSKLPLFLLKAVRGNFHMLKLIARFYVAICSFDISEHVPSENPKF